MAAPVIVHPDSVALALPYLRTALADVTVTVAASVPAVRPVRLVVVRRVGGLDRTLGIFDRPRLDVQVWAASDFDAQALAQKVRGHLVAAPGRVAGVSAASTFLGPTNIPDDESGAPRCLTTVEWQVRGTQLA